MKLTPDRMDDFKDKTCFICGRDLLEYSQSDLAYVPNTTGRSVKHKPERYYLFPCPECGQVAHKRCWYERGERAIRKGLFSKEYQLQCPSCGRQLSPTRDRLTSWSKGYEIPGHPDPELIEVHILDIASWKRGRKVGSFINMIGKAIETFFKAVGLGSLTDAETSSVARAAQKIGKGINDVAEQVFKLDISPDERGKLKELKCQNCGAPLPVPAFYEDAVVCPNCNTAHLLHG